MQSITFTPDMFKKLGHFSDGLFKALSHHWFFWGVLIFTSIPFILGPGFPTYDGPAHLHNVRIFHELLFGADDFMANHYSINPHIVPNYAGHLLLWLLTLIIPPLLAEKLIFLGIMFLMVLGFRKLLDTISGSANHPLAFTGLFFFLAFPLAMGFLNFLIGVTILVYFINFLLATKNPLGSWRDAGILLLFFSTSYFSHLMILGLALVITGLWFIVDLFVELRGWFSRGLRIFFAAAPALYGVLLYVQTRSGHVKGTHLPFNELLINLFRGDGLAAYTVEELVFTSVFFWMTLGIVAIGSVYALRGGLSKAFLKPYYTLIIILGGLGLMYFLLPDSDDAVAYITKRINYVLLLILMALAGLVSGALPKWMTSICVVVFLGIHIGRTLHFAKVHARQNRIVKELVQIEKITPEHAVLLPFNESGNWLIPHYSNYLGISKPMVILENYEASNDYFPVRWQLPLPGYQVIPHDWVNGLPGFKYLVMDQQRPSMITHIFVMKDPNQTRISWIPDKWKGAYKLIYEGKYANLYQLENSQE
jgi:hypothetical protein